MPEFKNFQIFKIAETGINDTDIFNLFEYLGAEEWYIKNDYKRECSDSEFLVEVAGRMCYKSFGTELNPNITKTREGNDTYLQNVLSVKHGSILENASCTFAIMGVSRVFTHELVRHRAGTAMSQESMRFVRVDNIRFYYPDSFGDSPDIKHVITEHLKDVEKTYKALINKFFDNPDMPFSEKKKITSALRRLLPDGILTDIVFTANHRAWRHMIEMRTAPAAEEEIRKVFNAIALRLKNDHPNLYQDMNFDSNDNGFKFSNSKV